MRSIVLIVILFTFLPRIEAQDKMVFPQIVILSVEGDITYKEDGFQVSLPLQVGQIVSLRNVIYPSAGSLLRVICPDGKISEFVSSQLKNSQAIPCPTLPNEDGEQGNLTLRIQRGGRQDVSIPYLIEPRGTTVRSDNITLVWNAPLNVENYELILRKDGEVIWTSEKLLPENVVVGQNASYPLPVSLVANVPYTVEICVLFTTMNSGCTTEPLWSSAVNVAFYFVPDLVLDDQLKNFDIELGSGSAESLYAQSLLLSQPLDIDLIGRTDPIGYYGEAINLLTQLLEKYPDSELARSPILHNTLGDLYRMTSLPISAARAYQKALVFSLPATEPAALASLGSGMTTPAGDETQYYAMALDIFEEYLTHDAFIEQFHQICKLIGDICLELPQCNTVITAECSTWFKEK